MKTFIITHILILKGPPKYRQETKPFEMKLYGVNELPQGFSIKPTWGDAFLMYKDDGTIRTACSRNFFNYNPKNKVKKWKRWPYLDYKSPDDCLKEEE